MLSFRHQPEGFAPSMLCFCAFCAMFLGIMGIILGSGQSSNHQTDTALHYINKAEQFSDNANQAQSLYQLSEQSMVSAIIADPFDPARWQILSDVLFTLGKDQSALIAQKMAHRLQPSQKFDSSAIRISQAPRFNVGMAQAVQQ